MKTSTKIKVVTLCSGYGAQEMAFDRLSGNFPEFDWELLAWSEIEPNAIKAHKVCHPEYADRNLGDMTKADYSMIKDSVDVLFYSTPCQSVSVAGQNKGMIEGSDAASALIWHTRRAIETLKPKICILENVKGMIMGKNIYEFRKWQSVIEDYGYTNFIKVLNSKDYGIPQNRERLFMISILNCTRFYNFPKPFKLEKRIRDIIEPYGMVDESFYFSVDQLFRIVSLCEEPQSGQREVDALLKEGISIHPLNRKLEFQGYKSIRSDSSPCLTAHDGRGGEPVLWQRLSLYDNNAQAGRVYDVNGLAPCLDTCGGDNREPKILEPVILKRPHGFNKGGLATDLFPTATSSWERNNYLREPQISNDPRKAFDVLRFVDECPTLLASDFKSPKLVREPVYLSMDNLPDKTVLQDEDGKGYLWQDGGLWRVRKLVPIECGRLMGVSDRDVEKMIGAGINKTGLYRLFGNSIVVDVLYYLFYKLFINPENEDAQLSLFDFF